MVVNATNTKIINFDFIGFNFNYIFKYHANSCSDLARCNCDEIEQVNEIKYLGIVLDNKIMWKPHINKLRSEVRKSITTFYFLRNICNAQCLRSLYFALINSRLQYGIQFWGGTHDVLINKLFVTQKYFIRIISFKNQRDHTEHIFKVLRLFFKMSGNRGTKNLTYKTRSTSRRLFVKPKVNKSFFLKTFVYLGPKFLTCCLIKLIVSIYFQKVLKIGFSVDNLNLNFLFSILT
ncbi:hypothetical protein J6590_108218 [Homalodisca vitripennis]|nr:hypothetical protein J6590_108218 [Homalodisca vitripennis]